MRIKTKCYISIQVFILLFVLGANVLACSPPEPECYGDDCDGCKSCVDGVCEDDNSKCGECCYCDDGECIPYDPWCDTCYYCDDCECECVEVDSIWSVSSYYYTGQYDSYIQAHLSPSDNDCTIQWDGDASINGSGKIVGAWFNTPGEGLRISAKTSCVEDKDSGAFTVVEIIQFEAKSSNFPKCVGDSISKSDFIIKTDPTGYESQVVVTGLSTSSSGIKTAYATLWNYPDGEKRRKGGQEEHILKL